MVFCSVLVVVAARHEGRLLHGPAAAPLRRHGGATAYVHGTFCVSLLFVCLFVLLVLVRFASGVACVVCVVCIHSFVVCV